MVAVSEKGAPAVNVTSVTQSSCGNNDGSILLAVAGGTGSYVYSWTDEAGSPVGSSRDLTGVGPGVYSVSVSDGSGCYTYATATIPAETPMTELICLVTADTVADNIRNVVVWNKTPGQGIVGYKLYRETTSAGVFDSIAYIPVDSLSQYTDDFADPNVRSWRYKIATVNSCGVESRLSPPHKTIHLTLNLGLLNHINLIWNNYEGFEPLNGSYKIWRYTSGAGWEMINTVPVSNTNTNTYTDETAPADADLWYFVEAERLSSCTALKAATYNASRSNRKTKLKSAPESVQAFIDEYRLLVYPNPGNGLFTVRMTMDRTENLNIKVFDLGGKLVYIQEFRGISEKVEQVVDLSGLEKGMYQLHLRTDRGLYNRMLVIQ